MSGKGFLGLAVWGGTGGDLFIPLPFLSGEVTGFQRLRQGLNLERVHIPVCQ